MLIKKCVVMRWKKKDIEELKRVIRNYNSKLNRLKKTYPENIKIYPEQAKYKEIKEKITTRQDYKRIVNELKLFTKRGSEYIVVNKHKVKAMVWELEIQKLRVKEINKERSRELKRINKIDITIGGKKIETASITIAKRELAEKKFNFDNMYSRSEFSAYKKTTDKQVLSNYWINIQNKYIDNYIKALVSVFNESQAERLIEMIKQITLEDMIELYHKEMLGNIDFIYEPQEQGIKYEYLMEMFKDCIKKKGKKNEFEIDNGDRNKRK